MSEKQASQLQAILTKMAGRIVALEEKVAALETSRKPKARKAQA
jgi:hypothetical protein